jgi:hypothetical protein
VREVDIHLTGKLKFLKELAGKAAIHPSRIVVGQNIDNMARSCAISQLHWYEKVSKTKIWSSERVRLRQEDRESILMAKEPPSADYVIYLEPPTNLKGLRVSNNVIFQLCRQKSQ